MTTNIEIKHLITCNRLPNYKLLSLLLYLPAGLIILTLRILLALCLVILGYGLSDSTVTNKIINKIACLALGITVTVENPQKKENVDVYISNSLSVFDQLVMHTATGSVSPGVQFIKSKGLGTYKFGSETNLEAFKKSIIAIISENKTPVHFTPEGKITNGKALLKFKTLPFQCSNKVQPVAISVDRPLLDISVTKCGTSYFYDVFFYMFSPVTSYKLKFLSPLEKKSLSDEEFAEIVRQNVATALKIETTDFTASDLNEWEKRKLAEEHRTYPQPSPISSLSANSDLRRMSLLVKEVLPHVPYIAIYNDISVTRSVDNTITNILDGRVQFIPERLAPASSLQSQPSTSSTEIRRSFVGGASSHQPFNTAASSFSKSAHERTKSFQERKQQLIANARQRYIEKHNLDIPF